MNLLYNIQVDYFPDVRRHDMMPTGIYSRDVACEIASKFEQCLDDTGEDRYFELILERTRRRSGTLPEQREEFSLQVRPIDAYPRLVDLAAGGKLARCVTLEGKRLDIYFGHPRESNLMPAQIELET
jgi:hypothetical protein